MNPFVGLRAFQDDENHLFFGREAVVRSVISKLSAGRFLAVVGPSGSGKSSIVRAGVLPALDAGFLRKGGTDWRFCTFRPAGQPLVSLAQALEAVGMLDEPLEGDRGQLILSVLERGKRGLSEVVRQSRLAPHTSVLVLVDQFEEIFRYTDEPAALERVTAFVKLLLEAARDPDVPIWVMLTMRTDFLGDCVRFRGLAEAISDNQVLIPRMSRRDRRLAITGPVAVAGASATPRLVTTLLNDVGDEPDQLPMLQHALRRTFAHWHAQGARGPLDLSHYRAIGTVRAALDQHANEAFAQVSPSQRTLAERVFRAVTVTEGGRGVRRPMQVHDLAAVTGATPDQVLQIHAAFSGEQRGFLMPLEGDQGRVDISHESLMRVWGRLRDWVSDEAAQGALFGRLMATSALHAAGDAGLYQGPELALALAWRERRQPSVGWLRLQSGVSPTGSDPTPCAGERAMAYLAESEAARDRAVAAAARRTRVMALLGALLVVASVGVALWVSWLAKEADRERDNAKEATALAVQAHTQALAQRDEAGWVAIWARAKQAEADWQRSEAERLGAEADRNKTDALAAADRARRSNTQLNKTLGTLTEREHSLQVALAASTFAAARRYHELSRDPSVAAPFLAEIQIDFLPTGATALGWDILTAPHAVSERRDSGASADRGLVGHGLVVGISSHVWLLRPSGQGYTVLADADRLSASRLSTAGVGLGFEDGTVRVFDSTGAEQAAPPSHIAAVSAVLWTPTLGWVSGSLDGTVHWDGGAVSLPGPVVGLVGGDAPFALTEAGPYLLTGAPHPTLPASFLTAAADSTLYAHAGPGGVQLPPLGNQGEPANPIVVGLRRAVGSASVAWTAHGTAVLWDSDGDERVTGGVIAVDVSPDGRRVALAQPDQVEVWTLDPDGRLWDRQWVTGFGPHQGAHLVGAGFTPSGDLVTLTSAGVQRTWDLDSNATSWPVALTATTLEWSADGALSVDGAVVPLPALPLVEGPAPVWQREGDGLRVQDAAAQSGPSTLFVLADPVGPSGPADVVASPDRRWVVVRHTSGRIRVWWVPTPEQTQALLRDAPALCDDRYRIEALGDQSAPFSLSCR